MAAKRKISIRKVLQVFTTLVVTVSCVIAISSAAKIEGTKCITDIQVHINSDKKYHLFEEKRIYNEALRDTATLKRTPISKVDLASIENTLKADPLIADASTYMDANRILHVTVTQRIPVVHIFDVTGNSYFMDNTASRMPDSFAQYTHVVTNVPMLTTDSASMSFKKQILSLVHTIQADTFWCAQVAQIIVDSDRTFELVPVLGQQRIIFGDTSRMKEKFSNLYTFYINVLNRVGWDKYETLDVRFRGQVVAAPSLPYKGPVDKAATGMNWVNSIVQTEAAIDSLHSQKEAVKAAAKAELAVADKKETTPEKKDAKNVEKKDKPGARKVAAEVKNAKPQAKDKKDDKKKEEKKDAKKEAKPTPKKDDKKDKGKAKESAKKDDKKDHAKDKGAPKKEEKKKEEKKPKYTLPEHKDHQ